MSEIRNRKRARFPFVCIRRATTTLTFQVETRKFEGGIAEKQKKMIVTTCVIYVNRVLARYLLMCGELGTESNLISVFS